LPIAILVPIRIRIENPQIFPSWESPYDSAKRENALAVLIVFFAIRYIPRMRKRNAVGRFGSGQ
jgi:hypothetical protein